jgi:hypothetical protein
MPLKEFFQNGKPLLPAIFFVVKAFLEASQSD